MLDLLFHDVNATARFEVWIDGIFFAVFTECQLPALTMKPEEITEGGQNTYLHQLPTRVTVGTLKLRMGMSFTNELLDWYLDVMTGETADSRRNLAIIFYNVLGIPISTYFFMNAFPVRYAGPSFKANESAVAIEEIELAFHGFGVIGGFAMRFPG